MNAARNTNVLVALACILGATSVSAALNTAHAAAEATEPARDAERRLLVQGAALYEQGEFAAALKKFEHAYATVPSAKILFNFGQAYRGLARNAEAIDAFTRFLQEAPDAEAGLRQAAQTYVAELKATVGSLEVQPSTSNADLFIDGRLRGRLPLQRRILLDPGPHQISVEKLGYATLSKRVDIAAGGISTIVGTLVPLAAPPARAGSPALAIEAPTEEDKVTSTRLYRRWWLWSALGVVAAGSVTTAFLLTREPATFPCTGCTRIPVR